MKARLQHQAGMCSKFVGVCNSLPDLQAKNKTHHLIIVTLVSLVLLGGTAMPAATSLV